MPKCCPKLRKRNRWRVTLPYEAGQRERDTSFSISGNIIKSKMFHGGWNTHIRMCVDWFVLTFQELFFYKPNNVHLNWITISHKVTTTVNCVMMSCVVMNRMEMSTGSWFVGLQKKAFDCTQTRHMEWQLFVFRISLVFRCPSVPLCPALPTHTHIARCLTEALKIYCMFLQAAGRRCSNLCGFIIKLQLNQFDLISCS